MFSLDFLFDFSKYSLTTCEPGAKEVLTKLFTFKPLATAFLANKPAAIKTEGLEVLVQEVMAAIATSFGATDVVTQTAPFVPAAYAHVTDGQRVCPHGTMTRIHGLTGKFGPYKGHFCPAKQGDMTKCTTQYIKANQPEWNSFQADQTKA